MPRSPPPKFIIKYFWFSGNLALSKNVDNRKPVRVVRGFKLTSPYAPAEGYRYDGKQMLTSRTAVSFRL